MHLKSASSEAVQGHKDEPLGGRRKRALDIAVALTALVLLSPLLLSVMALIYLREGRPIFYGHERIGCGGRRFFCLKFRTMRRDTDEILERHLKENPAAAIEWGLSRKLRVDPRVSPFGRLLRETSIDELPQLINILRGEMSCVGPRPITPDETLRYGSKIGAYYRSRPGLTGAWQIGGRSNTSYEYRVSLDCRYVANWTLFSDILIMAKTVPVVISRRGSH